MRIVGDDDPRGWRAQMMHQPQGRIDILKHADGVGDHDVVERPLDRGERRRVLDVAEHEIKIGMQLIGLGDGLGAEVDADAIGRLKRHQQIAAAASQFQHALARRNQEAHELEVVLVIGGVEFAPTCEFVAIGFEMVDEVALPLRRQPQRSSGIGRSQIHLKPRRRQTERRLSRTVKSCKFDQNGGL